MNLEMVFGSAEIKQFDRFEEGRMVSYGYSIHRDRNGDEVSRTAPTHLGSIGWNDGSPFTEDDYKKIITPHSTLNRKAWSFWGKLKNRIRFPVK